MTSLRLVLPLAVLLGAATAGAPSASLATAPPELPRVHVPTTMPTRSGHTIAVAAGGDLQAAIDRASPGDDIVLAAGATYTGPFLLPAKPGATTDPTSRAVITLRSAAADALPVGQRVSPAQAPSMARLVTATNGAEPIGTAPGAAGWRLIGLEITAAPSVTQLGRLVRLGDGNPTQNAAAQVPVNLVVERSYVHGTPTLDIRRCIDLQSAVSAVVDSYIAECHSVGSDAQAIAGWNGPGPYTISNNYLEGSGENVMFGGAPVAVPNQMPSDIEITRNYIAKPLSWKADDPSYAGTQWSIKNLLELKCARRVLIEGNVFERSWVQAQVGFALLFKGASESAATSDITVRHNIIRGAANGINLFGDVAGLARVAVIDNELLDIGSASWAPAQDQGRLFQVMGVADVMIRHNTGSAPSMLLAFDGANPGFAFLDNVVALGLYGVKGPGTAAGAASLAAFAPGFRFLGNLLIGPDPAAPASYPSGNRFAATIADVGLAPDQSLVATSPYRGTASDGGDPGVIVATVLQATAGVTTGSPATPPTTRDRATARGDSIRAAARCWRFVRAPASTVAPSACPDSTEAARLASAAPLAHATAEGFAIMLAQGDTLTLRATVIREYVFVAPALRRTAPQPGDTLVTGTALGRQLVRITVGGRTGSASVDVVPRS